VKFWARRGAVAWLLWPVSLVFAVAVVARRILYKARILRSEHPGIPVVVVGNLTVGGTGKTPLVIWIAEFLAKNGWAPGVISRGYGGSVTTPRAATIAADAAEVGDEPILISRRGSCPVWVGPDRVQVAAALRAAEPKVNVLISDDGLQHYRLRRDVEIAVVDQRGFGNGFLLPAGPLREPRWRLKTVDTVVVHGKTMHLEGDTVHRMTDANDRRPLAAFAGQKVHAVAGIGDPERFFQHLAKAGVKIVPHPFPDHHPFAPGDLAFGDDAPVLLTEKDAVKLRSAPRPNRWVLPVAAKLEPAFGAWLLGRLNDWRRSKAA
jgi:tetraacyldisaccharide 4'-kinase